MTQGGDQRLRAARDLLAFWEEAGVDVSDALRLISSAPVPAPVPAVAPAVSTPLASAPRPAAAPPALTDSAATARARSATTLAALRSELEAIDGGQLKAAARGLVFAEGPENAPVVVVGERPGVEEDESGRPFVGRSGRLLDGMLASIGLSRERNALITNVVFWRPPGDRPPTQGEVALCLPFCERLIEIVQPKVVLVLGSLAVQSLVKRSDGAMKLRGRRLSLPGAAGLNAMVTLHPAYLLRRPQEKALAWADMLALDAWLDELGVERVARP